MTTPKLVVIGAGFGGLEAVKVLARSNEAFAITVIDEKNHHLFQPLLYQVATAGLSPAEIAAPVRSILSNKSKSVSVVMQRALRVDPSAKEVHLKDGQIIPFDVLLLACGASHSYFGHDRWAAHAPGLKTLEQALEIRSKILTAFEQAEQIKDQSLRLKHMTFVVIGGGPTGVELAGAIAEISRQTLKKDFVNIDPRSTRIILVEGQNRILSSFSEKLSQRAKLDLETLGVTVWTSTKVTDITEDGVKLGGDFVQSKTVIWAAGVAPAAIIKESGLPVDAVGRVRVNSNLQVEGLDHIFAIGDMASFVTDRGHTLPGLAPVAMQQGRRVAKNIRAFVKGQSLRPFVYQDKGQMATIGRKRAVAMYKGLEMSGSIAWLMWLVIHIYYLVGFRNKVFVFFQWVSSYVFFKRGARII